MYTRMLTRSQAVLVNNFLKKEENDGVGVNMVLRNGTVVPKKCASVRKPEGCFTIIRTRSQARKKLKVDTSYGEDDVPSPPHAPSGTRMAKYVVDIDFDEASREWRKNKRSIGNGCYRYK